MAVTTVRVPVALDVLRWAVARSGRGVTDLQRSLPQVRDWLDGIRQPTMRQLEAFASSTYTPLGYLFLPQPPIEALPLPDFRTLADQPVDRPSANLLDTIYLCERRQEWFRDYARREDLPPVAFVGTATDGSDPLEVSDQLRQVLGFAEGSRGSTWTTALSRLAERAETAGVLVMISGVVGHNTHRLLDPGEFRGFAIADRLAPVVFVNGADTKAAQIFTLVHELAHLWRGQSGVSAPEVGVEVDSADERWCNAVAADFLIPPASLREAFDRQADLTGQLDELATRYKVSTLAVLRQLFDVRLLDADTYYPAQRAEKARVLELARTRTKDGGGGDFLNTAPVRASKRFTRALITDTHGGGTLHREAFRLVGTRKSEVFEDLGRRLGVA